MQPTIMGLASQFSQRKVKTFLDIFLRTERGLIHRTPYLLVNRTLKTETKPRPGDKSVFTSKSSPDINIKSKSETEKLLNKLKSLKGSVSEKLRLSETMTPELEQLVLENQPNRSFLLRQALVEIKGAEDRTKHLLSLPESLTDERRKIKIFQGHHEMLRQEGQLLPSSVTEKNLTDILHLTGTSRIKKYLSFMFKTEISQFNEGLRKAENAKRTEEMKKIAKEKKANANHIVYGLGENVIMHRISDSTMNSFFNWIAVREFHEWGIPLVIDMSHHKSWKMDRSSKKSLFTELSNSISINRMYKTPFQLHITGLQEEHMESLKKIVPSVNEPDAAFNATSQNHLDLFPAEKMVYLSPDSNNDLQKFNPDDIYVIGGIIDKGNDRLPLTLSAAKRLRIRHARFPMRQHLGLTGDLNVDSCVAIMNDLKASQDWFYSFRWVPSRHLGNRVKTNLNPSLQHQLAYRAHRHLTPNSWKGETESVRNLNLGPAQYRMYYQKIKDCKTREELDELLEELKI